MKIYTENIPVWESESMYVIDSGTFNDAVDILFARAEPFYGEDGGIFEVGARYEVTPTPPDESLAQELYEAHMAAAYERIDCDQFIGWVLFLLANAGKIPFGLYTIEF